jgi:hypothetical protein
LEQLRRHVQADAEIFRELFIGLGARRKRFITAIGERRTLVLRQLTDDGRVSTLYENVGDGRGKTLAL